MSLPKIDFLKSYIINRNDLWENLSEDNFEFSVWPKSYKLMEEAGFMSYTAASDERVTVIHWLPFCETLPLYTVCYIC